MKKVFFFILVLVIGIGVYFSKRNIPETPPTAVSQPEAVKVDELILSEEEPTKDDHTLVKLQEEFERKEKDLPTLSSLKNLSDEEAHHTSEFITEGAKIIGEAQEAASIDPTRREATLEFFLNCAINEDIVPAIRALCWNRTLKESTNWGIVLPLSEFEIPEDIRKLSHQMN